MKASFDKMVRGYQAFRKKYTGDDNSIMQQLASNGQKPETMVIACCDSRVDPALILQCHPGDLFVVRNVANIVPPYEADEGHHGTSAALEFGICYLRVKHLIILGHSQCGGIEALLNTNHLQQDDFITRWVSLIRRTTPPLQNTDSLAKAALLHSYHNCLSFPWINERVVQKTLSMHLWYFDIKTCEIVRYSFQDNDYLPLE